MLKSIEKKRMKRLSERKIDKEKEDNRKIEEN